MRMIKRCVVALAAASLGACSLDLQSPNQPTDSQVTSSPDGVIALATGLQARFATSYFNYAYMAGVVTDEFAATSAALISISDAEQGACHPAPGSPTTSSTRSIAPYAPPTSCSPVQIGCPDRSMQARAVG